MAEYVGSRIRAGVGRAEVREELLAVGWTEEEAEVGYRAGLIATGVPVPTEGNRPTLSRKSSTVDVVINFFSFILLGISASALGTLFFEVINISFPDLLDRTYLYSGDAATSSIHYAIAALVIAFPLYYFAMRLWFRKFREDEGRTESKLSKWLTYLVLLMTAVTMVGDLITVVFTLLQGEVTVRFFLKALTILVIACWIFGFYYMERRKIQYHIDIPQRIFQILGQGMMGLVVVGVVLGFVVGGSPTTERNRTFDRTRAENLSTLSTCVENYARDLGALPKNLKDLSQSSQYSYCASSMLDPETRAVYEYRVVTLERIEGAGKVGEFELCATFALPTPSQIGAPDYMNSTVWGEHSAGHICHTVNAQLVVLTVVPTFQGQVQTTPDASAPLPIPLEK